MEYTSNTTDINNFFLNRPSAGSTGPGVNIATGQDKSPGAMRVNLGNYMSPVQLSRMKVNIMEWRAAVNEAELAYNPHRVKMQRMYLDTELNGHVFSVMDKRKDLTLLRGYKFVKKQGSEWVESKDLKDQFDEYDWFNDFISIALDAMFYGYSLVSLGDIVDGNFDNLRPLKRWQISPDREVVTQLIYQLDGKRWDDPDVMPWHIYVRTPDPTGVSKCGYGLFYKIALYEIFLRNVLGYNGDFVELYSQPYRVGKTHKTTNSERSELELALQNMGSAGYAIIDPTDEIAFLETNLGGTGWKGYENLEMRCQKIISKIVLGHADALDSTPGKLGSDQGELSPTQKALMDKQTKDGRFLMPIINRQLLPRIQQLGLRIPEGYKYILVNDDEAEQMRKRQDESNAVTATIAQTMSSAGLKMDPKYFEERTGIPTEEKPEPEVMAPGAAGVPGKPGEKPKPKPKKVKDQMDDLYAKR